MSDFKPYQSSIQFVVFFVCGQSLQDKIKPFLPIIERPFSVSELRFFYISFKREEPNLQYLCNISVFVL